MTPRSQASVEAALTEREQAAAAAAAAANSAQAASAQLTARAKRAEALADQAAQLAASDTGTQEQAAAAAAVAAAAVAAADAASRDAQLTARRAAVEHATVAASKGSFALVYEGGWRSKEMEVFRSEDEAKTAATSLWSPWILYLEQRGSFTEVDSGGIGLPFAHATLRKYVEGLMNKQMAQAAFGSGSQYGQNY